MVPPKGVPCKVVQIQMCLSPYFFTISLKTLVKNFN
jgi:hypothetical protein